MDKNRAESVFNDMKTLFDATVREFEEKIDREKFSVAGSYERIMEKHNSMIINFENQFS